MVYASKNKRDGNEAELVAIARQLGAEWWEGPPLDGWLWHRKTDYIPVEIKQPYREGRTHEFTPAQKRFFARCKTHGLPYLVWRTERDVLESLGARVSA